MLLVASLGISILRLLYPYFSPDVAAELAAIQNLALAAALINVSVLVAINPLRFDRVPDRFPAILQDFIVIALVLVASTFFSDRLLTTSAVSAVVLGFALQDTLGNAFAGLAIQSEKPFHVGHWVRVGEFEGRVEEVTWRATKLRTKSGNFVVLPNNVVSKEAITNYSEPNAPTRLEVQVGAGYEVPPNVVKAAVLEALRNSSRILQEPLPTVELLAFDASAITYLARFWVYEYEHDDAARDEARTAIYYAFQRHRIEIPWPIQVEYEGGSARGSEARTREQERLLSTVDLLAPLSADVRQELAASTPLTVYGSGEAIVRQGEPGQSMFVVCAGAVRVVLEPARQEIARIERGGYFGEMSLLTGEPRSATVLAAGDVSVIEIGAELFRRIAAENPHAMEQIGMAAVARRAALERIRTATAGAVTVETNTLLARMKKFLGFGGYSG